MTMLMDFVQTYEMTIQAVAVTALVSIPVVWLWAQRSFIKSRDGLGLMRSMLEDFSFAYVRIFPAVGRVESSALLASLMGWQRSPADLSEFLARLDDEGREKFKRLLDVQPVGKDLRQPAVIRNQDMRFIEFIPMREEQLDNAVTLLCRDVTSEYRRMLMVQTENDALKEEGRRYAAMLNDTDTLVWMRDTSMTIQYCNLAYTSAVSVHNGDEDMVGIPELYRQAPQLARKAIDTGEIQRERRHLVVGDTRRYYKIRESYIKDMGMTVGMARDITELGEAEEELSRYNSLLNDLLESSTSAVAIFGKDTRLKFYNQAYVRMWSFGETWLDAHPTFSEVLEFLRENRRLPEQANFSAFKKLQLKLFTDLMEPSEEFFYLPDGRTLRNVRIPHAMGGVLFTYEDVTDRLALERSYNTLIAVQRETLDNLHEGIIVFGEDGKIRLNNPVFRILWGVREADVAAGTHLSSVLEAIRPLVRTKDWDGFKKEFIAQVQSRRLMASRMERADGKVLDWSMVPLPDGGTLLTYVDVTDTMVVELSLRERNEALQAADRLKSEFLANVSYELRSPLTSISGFADMLQQDYFGRLTEKQREYVEGIAQSSSQLIHIISDILDLASIEAGYLTLDISEFDIQKMIQSVLALMVERMKREQIEARVVVDEDIGMMRGDETRIRQVMFHLMSNAVKYSPSKTTVEVGARREEDGIYLWVKDQGQGIAPEEQARIFDKFYRGRDGARKAGTGLGLSMVRSFIGLHGGRVVLDSEQDKGATFTCVIPYNPHVQTEETSGVAA